MADTANFNKKKVEYIISIFIQEIKWTYFLKKDRVRVLFQNENIPKQNLMTKQWVASMVKPSSQRF